MKKALSLALAVLMLLSVVPVAVSAADVIDIATAAELVNINNDLSGSYRLTANIDLKDYPNWTPIGGSTAFSGSFEGNGKTISNLNVAITSSETTVYAGLFGNVTGSVKNLTVNGKVSATVNTTGAATVYAGGVAGNVSGWLSSLEGCTSKVTVTAELTTAAPSSAWITPTSTVYAGGIAGNSSSWGGTNECSHNGGSVTGKLTTTGKCNATVYSGGIFGKASGTIENCYNSVPVTTTVSCAGGESNGYAGGLASSGSSFKTSYNNGTINSNDAASRLGSIAGYATGSATNCYYLKDSAPSAFGSYSNTDTPPTATALSATGMWNQKCAGFDYENVWDAQIFAAPVLYTKDEIIGGTLSVAGEYVYGQKLTADMTAVTPAKAWNGTISWVSYQWYRGTKNDSSDIEYTAIDKATKKEYTITADDIGFYIMLTVRGRFTYGGSLSSTGKIVNKVTPATPAAPTVASKTDTSVTLSAVAGAEYGYSTYNKGFMGIGAGWNDPTWSASNVFTGLTPETNYAFYVRIKESATSFASSQSAATEATTYPEGYNPYAVSGSVAVTGNAQSGQKLTAVTTGLSAAQAGTISYTYQWNRDGSAIGGATASTYTLTNLDIGFPITVTVTAKSPYTGVFTSNSVNVVLGTPAGISATSTGTGITLKWNAVTGATGYKVYRYSTNIIGIGSWSSIGTATTTSYTDTTAASGTEYKYSISATKGTAESSYDTTGVTAIYIAAPTLKTLTNAAGGVTLSWNTVSGVDSYKVFRKTGSAAAWTEIASGVTGGTYTDTTVASGSTYTYTVGAVKGTSVGAYDATGLSIVYLAAPVIGKATNAANGINVSWAKVTGASKYTLYRKLSTESAYTELITVTALSYTDTSAVSGKTYSYKVCAANAAGKTGVQSAEASCTFLAAPVLSSAENAKDGIQIKWNAVTGATSYNVYRKTGSAAYTLTSTVTTASYIDTTAINGTTYTYTAEAVNGASKSIAATTGVTCTRLTDPAISTIANTSTGVKISWTAAPGATSYTVKRRVNGESVWTNLGTVNTTSYTDAFAQSGTTYEYCVNSVKSPYTAYFAANYKAIMFLATPVINTVDAEGNGVKLSWGAVAGAVSYNLYRKTGSGALALLTTVSGTDYTDLTIAQGTAYSYVLEAVNGSAVSAKSAPKAYATLDTPVISSIKASATGVTIKWAAVKDATTYTVSRKTADEDEYKVIKSGLTALTFTDTAVVSGTSYTYIVTATGKNGAVSDNSAQTEFFYLSIPELTKIQNTEAGVRVTFGTVVGADNYRVYRKYGSSSWILIARTAKNYYVDTKAASGTVYKYTIIAEKRDGESVWSSYCISAGITLRALSAPVISKISASSSALTITWGAVTGAKSYNVYRKTGSSGWTRLKAGITACSYSDTTVAAGTSYYYTIIAVGSDANSAYKSAGTGYTFMKAPVLSSVVASTKGPKLTWGASKGATGYYVYRKVSGGSWAKIASVGTVTSYTDTTAKSGTTYYYTVVATRSSNRSTYNKTGISIMYLSSPKMSAPVNTGSAIKITWGAVKGATGYIVYRKVGSGGWTSYKKLGKVTSFADTSVKSGTLYYYSVRAITSKASSSRFAVSIVRLSAPKLVSAAKGSTYINFKWQAVAGAANYAIYRKATGQTSWVRVTTVGKVTSYVDKNVKKGVTYTYTVRAVNGKNASAYYGGISCKF